MRKEDEVKNIKAMNEVINIFMNRNNPEHMNNSLSTMGLFPRMKTN